MRVAVLQSSCPAPSEIFIYNQVAALRALDHEVELYAYRGKQATSALRKWYKREIGAPIRYPWRVPPEGVARTALMRVQELFASSNSKTVLRAANDPNRFGWWGNGHLHFWAALFAGTAQPDVVHGHFAPVAAIAAMLKEIGAVTAPLVASLHGADVTSQESHEHVRSGLYPWLWKHADLYTYNSTFIRDAAVAMGFPETRMTPLPVGIGKQFELSPPRRRQSATGATYNILSVGRLVPKKGHLTALEAIAVLRRKVSKLQYTIVGEGPLRPAIERRVTDLELGDVVRLEGAATQEEVRNQMLQSDVFFFPSETPENGDMEGQGLVVQEAQACQLPVVVTRHNGVPDGMIDTKTGFVVDERDTTAMANRLAFLANLPESRAEMGRAGRDFVMSHYTQAVLGRRLEDILKSVL